jgi:hypothetical protein
MRRANRQREALAGSSRLEPKDIPDTSTLVNGTRQGDRHVTYRYQL